MIRTPGPSRKAGVSLAEAVAPKLLNLPGWAGASWLSHRFENSRLVQERVKAHARDRANSRCHAMRVMTAPRPFLKPATKRESAMRGEHGAFGCHQS